MTRVLHFVALALAILCCAGPAAAYNPWNDWRTLTTPNFRIHYPVGYYRDALHFGRAAEDSFAQLVMRLGWRPDTPIDMVLNDDTDSANGFARAVPYNLVGLNAVAPGDLSVLNDYDDWRYLLMAHELTHIIHIDTVRGLPAFLNSVFGRQFVPNAVLPRWLIEGMAVYYESEMTSAGRLRSSFFDMMLRMHTLADREMDIGEVTGFPQRWPQGTAPYLYGGHFMAFLVEEHGEDFFRRINLDYGDDIVPYGVNVTARRAIGQTYPELYREFMDQRRRGDLAALARVERNGRVEGERMTFTAQRTGPARYGEDGELYFIHNPIDDRPQLHRLVGPDDSERVAFVEVSADIAFVPGTRDAVISFGDIDSYYRVYQDLYRVNLDSGSREQITHGARAMSPDVSRQGTITFTQIDGGHSVLRFGRLENPNESQVLVDLGEDTQIFTPRFVSGGAAIVFTGFRNGQKDLYRVDVASGELKQLTEDRFLDGAPMPSADGRYIFFHSDRDGIYNIYAMPSEGGPIRRITRVVGGAFRPAPSPDGTRLAYQSYSSEGFDVSVLPLPVEIDALPVEPERISDRPPLLEVPSLEIYPTEEYSVWPSILPRSWLPIVGTDTQGTTAGVAVTGIDAVEEHEYALQFTQGFESRYPSFFAQYVNTMFHPGFNLSLSRSLGFANVAFERNGEREGVEESVWSAQASMAFPIWSRIDNAANFVVAYDISRRRRTEPLFFEPLDANPVIPSQGRFSSVFMGINVSNVRSYTDSISSEKGARLQLGVRLEDPITGSEFQSLRLTGNFAAFVENPLFERHVLALEAFAGYGISNYEERSLFGISGLPATDLVLNILNLNFGAGSALRGFPLAPIVGDSIGEAHLEYRFPIWDVQRGVDTLPVFFGNLSAAPFVDAAVVADDPDNWFDEGNRFASVGAELRLELVIGYAVGTTLRAGYGRAVAGEDTQAAYLVFGGVF